MSKKLPKRFFSSPIILSFIAGFGELFLFHLLFKPAETQLYAFGFSTSIFLCFAILLAGHIVQLIRLLRAPERKFWHYPVFIYLGIIILISGISALVALSFDPLA